MEIKINVWRRFIHEHCVMIAIPSAGMEMKCYMFYAKMSVVLGIAF